MKVKVYRDFEGNYWFQDYIGETTEYEIEIDFMDEDLKFHDFKSMERAIKRYWDLQDMIDELVFAQTGYETFSDT
jgi:hypothetical protein